jgi:hypothetical protein
VTALQLCTDASNSGEQGTRERNVDLLDHASIELKNAESTLRQFTARIDTIKKTVTSRHETPMPDPSQDKNSDAAAVTGDVAAFCSGCGKRINASSNFCRYCGNKVQ